MQTSSFNLEDFHYLFFYMNCNYNSVIFTQFENVSFSLLFPSLPMICEQVHFAFIGYIFFLELCGLF